MKQWSGRFEIDKSVEGLPIIPQMNPRAKKGWIRVRQQTLFLLLKASNFHCPNEVFTPVDWSNTVTLNNYNPAQRIKTTSQIRPPFQTF